MPSSCPCLYSLFTSLCANRIVFPLKVWRTTALHTNGHIHMLTWASVHNKIFITRPVCYVSFIILPSQMFPRSKQETSVTSHSAQIVNGKKEQLVKTLCNHNTLLWHLTKSWSFEAISKCHSSHSKILTKQKTGKKKKKEKNYSERNWFKIWERTNWHHFCF